MTIAMPVPKYRENMKPVKNAYIVKVYSTISASVLHVEGATMLKDGSIYAHCQVPGQNKTERVSAEPGDWTTDRDAALAAMRARLEAQLAKQREIVSRIERELAGEIPVRKPYT